MMIHRYFVAVVPVEMLVIVRDHIGLNVMILIFMSGSKSVLSGSRFFLFPPLLL